MSDYLAAERERFWRSAMRYYQSLALGYVKPNTYTAWERAKDDLQRVAEYAQQEREGRALPPLPESFRYKCPACEILQETQGVCADCVALFEGAAKALAAKKARDRSREATPGTRVTNSPLARLKSSKAIEQRIVLCGQLRRMLARYGRVHVSTTAALLGASRQTILTALHDIVEGADGQAPLKLILQKEGRGLYWEVAQDEGIAVDVNNNDALGGD